MGEQLTESDVKKIKEEIEYRKIVVRKKELEAVKEARAQGDLSENFEYKAAKQEKNRNESRIRFLENMIKTAVVIWRECLRMRRSYQIHRKQMKSESIIRSRSILKMMMRQRHIVL